MLRRRQSITGVKVIGAVKQLCSGRAPGVGKTHPELFEVLQGYHGCRATLRGHSQSAFEWQAGMIVPLLKKGN